MNFIDFIKTELLNLFSFLKFTFMFIAVVWIIGYCIMTFYGNRFYKNGIPEHIGITKIIEKKSFGVIREGCGGVVFKITEETAEKIMKQGVGFLNQDLHGRGYRDPAERQSYEYYTLSPWQETPYQEPSESEIGTGAGRPIWAGASCLFDGNEKYKKAYTEAKSNEGSYYSLKREGELLVIPELRLLVLTYFG